MNEEIPSVKVPGILIRSLQVGEEMSVGENLQRQIWGYSDVDIVPDHLFVVGKEVGGQVLGAFHQDKPIGFALSFVGVHEGTAYLHSHMVGVVADYQNQGVGRLLKLAQRDDAIARGIDLIEWTFDPLQLKNAHFNLMRIGAIVRRYIPNCYGRTSSPLHAGLPTDRLVAQWWVRSMRVQKLLSGETQAPRTKCGRVSIPVGIRQICNSDPQEAIQIQSRVREQFERHFADGNAAVGFEFDEQQGSYLLEPYAD